MAADGKEVVFTTSAGQMEDDGWSLPGAVWIEGDSLAPPCGSEPYVVQRILAVAALQPTDVVFDLGCGDGRVCIAAAEAAGCAAVGVELEDELVTKAHLQIEAKGLGELVQITQGDLLELDLSRATVLVIYLLPEAMELLKPKLVDCLRRGVRIISQQWSIKGFEPSECIHEFVDGFNVLLNVYDGMGCVKEEQQQVHA
jgi:SAM-dependent methyltransferase